LRCTSRDWLCCPGGWSGGAGACRVSGVEYEPNTLLKALAASLGQLGALKQLTLAWLDGREELPDALVRLTWLVKLRIVSCRKLKALPKGFSKLGALRKLNLEG
jgi:hypothetical protein